MNVLPVDLKHKKRRPLTEKVMLEKSKAKRPKENISPNIQHLEHSDDELLNVQQSMLHKKSNVKVTEDISGRDVTDSSIGISGWEANVNLKGSAGRTAKLDKLLEEGETLVEASIAPIDHLRAEACSPNTWKSQSQRQIQSNIEGRNISFNRTKLEEFEGLDNQDYNQMTEFSNYVVIAQPKFLNSMQLVNPEINNTNLQQKINLLETTTNNQKELICQLTEQLTDIRKHVKTLEIERATRNTEINNCKTQINNLNEQIRLSTTEKNLNTDRTLKQQEEYKAILDQFKQNLNLLDLTSVKNQTEIANIKAEQEKCARTLKDENDMFLDSLKKELLDRRGMPPVSLFEFETHMATYQKSITESVSQIQSQKTIESVSQVYELKFEKLISMVNTQRIPTILDYVSQLITLIRIIFQLGSFLAIYSKLVLKKRTKLIIEPTTK